MDFSNKVVVDAGRNVAAVDSNASVNASRAEALVVGHQQHLAAAVAVVERPAAAAVVLVAAAAA